jgi:hypothetical protein
MVFGFVDIIAANLVIPRLVLIVVRIDCKTTVVALVSQNIFTLVLTVVILVQIIGYLTV